MINYKTQFYGVKSWAQIQYLGKLEEAVPDNLLIAFYKRIESHSEQHYLSAFSFENDKIIHMTGSGNIKDPIIIQKEEFLPQTILYNAMAIILHQDNNNKVRIAHLLKEICEDILSPFGVESHWTVFSSRSDGKIMTQIGSYKEIEKAREHQKRAQNLFDQIKKENKNSDQISNIKTIFDPLGTGQDRIYFIQPSIFYQNPPIQKIS